MEDLGCHMQNRCTSSSYSKWNYCQLNSKHILLPMSRKALKQTLATTFREAWQSLPFTLIITVTTHRATLQRETDTQICSTQYSIRHTLFPTVKGVNTYSPCMLGIISDLDPKWFSLWLFLCTWFGHQHIFHLGPGFCWFWLQSE